MVAGGRSLIIVLSYSQCWGRINSNEFNSRVNSFTVSYEFELTHLRDCEL